MPKIFGAKSLSADGISAAIWCGTAGGTANAITLTIPGNPTVVAGMVISWRAAAANSGSVTINTGSGAKPLYKQVDPIYGISNLQSGAIQNRSQNFAQWSEYHEAWMLLSPVPLSASDIPSTLNTTTFGSGGVVVGWGNQVYKDSTTSNLYLLGGNQGTEARVFLYGNSHASKPGDAEYYTGTASGAAHSFFDKNGVEQLKIDENGATGGTNRLTSTAFLTNLVAGYNSPDSLVIGSGGQTSLSGRLATTDTATSVGTSFTTIRSLYGAQSLTFATITGKGTILLEWDGTTLTKLAGAASLVVAGSAGAGETAFRASGGNLQAIVDTGSRNVSAGLAISH